MDSLIQNLNWKNHSISLLNIKIQSYSSGDFEKETIDLLNILKYTLFDLKIHIKTCSDDNDYFLLEIIDILSEIQIIKYFDYYDKYLEMIIFI